MKKVLLITLIFLSILVNNTLYSQKIFPSYQDNPRWNISNRNIGGTDTKTHSFICDTNFCGYTYSKAYFYTTAYYRSDTARTHIRLSTDCNDKEYISYDYSMQVGDSLYVGFELFKKTSEWYPEDERDTIKIQLIKIDTVEYFGTPRRRFEISYEKIRGMRANDHWLEGIGSLNHPFYSLVHYWQVVLPTITYYAISKMKYNYTNTVQAVI